MTKPKASASPTKAAASAKKETATAVLIVMGCQQQSDFALNPAD